MTGENKLQTAIREAKEEIGIDIDVSNLKFVKTYHWKRDDMDLTFEVFVVHISSISVEVSLDKKENTKYLWANPKDLYKQSDLMKGLYPILEDNYLT